LAGALVQTGIVPLPAIIIVSLVSLGCVLYLANQIRALRRQRRNMKHWEKGEPLEGTGDWD
jgi:uncharacterized membrane protein SpoIIM required for sporulation